jgi:hypothetical protein
MTHNWYSVNVDMSLQPLEFHATAWGRPATDSITRQSDLERKMKMATEMIELHVTSPLSIFGHCSRTSSESLDELVDNLGMCLPGAVKGRGLYGPKVGRL